MAKDTSCSDDSNISRDIRSNLKLTAVKAEAEAKTEARERAANFMVLS